MHIFWTIVIGFIVGIVAKLLMPGRDPGGFVITTLLGIGGALAAKYMGVAMGYYQNTERVGFLAAVIGAVIILVLYRLVFRRIRGV